MKKFLIFILLIPQISFAQLTLNIYIKNKLGIDKGLILVSEVHSVERVRLNRPATLKLQSGVVVKIWATFSQEIKNIGPPDSVEILGHIVGPSGKIIKDFAEKMLVNIGEQKLILHEQPDQQIEIKIQPVII